MKIPQETYLKEFKELTEKMYTITVAKNGDYADSEDAFSNFTLVEHMKVATTEQGFFTRMTDKYKRVASLLIRPALVLDEKIEDTLLDLANYCLLLIIWLKHKKNN